MDLIQAVLRLAELPEPPERIVIESSGVADPAGIVRSFLEPEIWGTVQLDGVITVVDATRALDPHPEEERLARAQVAGGDLIVLNKVDLVDAGTVARTRAWIGDIHPGVQVFEAVQSRLPMEVVLGTGAMGIRSVDADASTGVHVHDMSTGTDTPDHDHDQSHGLVFDTWTYTSDAPVHLAMLESVLTHVPSTVFRVKGFVHVVEEPERRMVVQLVGRRATITRSRGWGTEEPRTRLVFISRHGTVDYAAIGSALDGGRSTGTPGTD
jgi:G3E family GTPase